MELGKRLFIWEYGPGIFHGTERNGTISRNLLGINYGTELSLVHLILCLEHSVICGASIVILSMSIYSDIVSCEC